MNVLKSMTNILILFLVLSCTIGAAMAAEEPKDTITVIHNDDTKASDSVDDSRNSGGLSADEIYSDEYVLGQKKGDSSTDGLFDVNGYIATIKSFKVLWAVIELGFALVGGAILILYPGTILWNAVKKIYVSKGENAEQAVHEVKKLNNKDIALTTGLGLSLCLVAGAMFLLSIA